MAATVSDSRLALHSTVAEIAAADPSGQHLLLTYGVRRGFRTGWISQGRLRPLPIRQPYPGHQITAW